MDREMLLEAAEENGQRIFCECGLSPINCVCGWTEKDFEQTKQNSLTINR